MASVTKEIVFILFPVTRDVCHTRPITRLIIQDVHSGARCGSATAVRSSEAFPDQGGAVRRQCRTALCRTNGTRAALRPQPLDRSGWRPTKCKGRSRPVCEACYETAPCPSRWRLMTSGRISDPLTLSGSEIQVALETAIDSVMGSQLVTHHSLLATDLA